LWPQAVRQLSAATLVKRTFSSTGGQALSGNALLIQFADKAEPDAEHVERDALARLTEGKLGQAVASMRPMLGLSWAWLNNMGLVLPVGIS